MRQIKVHGPIVSDEDKWIYDWFEMDCTTPGSFIGELAEADGDDVVVLINSTGGYVNQAAEIYEAIRSYKGNITGKVIGQACSCASFIACAMYCEISPIGSIFIHNCSGGAEGDYRAMQEAKDSLVQVNDNIILAYQEKTGMSKEQLQRMMDKNTTLSAREAVQYGFVDKISENSNYDSKVDDKGMVAAFSGGLLPISNLSEQKLNILHRAAMGMSTGTGKNNTNNKKEANMGSLQEFLASNPDAQKDFDSLLNQAKEDARKEGVANGVKEERSRMEAIDQISANVDAEMLKTAKYTNPINAAELAFEAMKKGAFRNPAVTDEPQKNTSDGVAAEKKAGLIEATAKDYADSNVKDIKTPAVDPLGTTNKNSGNIDDMASEMSRNVKRYV